ncbi:MAG TPA: glycosyltransferase family 39 protein [Candidatus Omnitrophota bacterium]|nr:glycosyltransferase family 39 protein [Candidatus Omnitrophota bacterium]
MKINSHLDIGKIGWWGMFVLIGLGILMRFYQITRDEFYLYDEGLYFNYNHILIKLWSLHPPESWEQWKQALLVWFRFSLASGKALWFLLVDARIFFGGIDLLFFPRLVSAVAGALTLWVTFLFAKRFYNSKWIGLLSVAFLVVLPSHVFYSRLGFQEALSTLFFISGFYFYVFPRALGKRTFWSGLFFVGAYFTNYRLIILPALIAFAEIALSLSEKKLLDFRKYLWHTLTFLFFVIIIGNLDMKQNAVVTYAWMFHQADLTKGHFNWFNLFSYPYYLFRLESFLFGVFFWGNLYYLYPPSLNYFRVQLRRITRRSSNVKTLERSGDRREWNKLFPFALVCFQMLIFSFPADHAARYLCVVTPFMAMAAASLVVSILEQAKDQVLKAATVGICVFALMSLFVKSFQIVASHSDYKPSMEFLTQGNPNARILSTQPWIQKLYVADQKKVLDCPHTFERFVEFYTNGFRFLILCPQAYISWTESGQKFTFRLENYLGFVSSSVKPVKVFGHLSRVMLERFVFEHNEDLWQSVVFLNSSRKDLGAIRVYDIREILVEMRQEADRKK